MPLFFKGGYHYHIHKTCMCILYIQYIYTLQIIWFVNMNPYTHRHSLPIPTSTMVHIRGVTGSIYFKDSRPRTGEVGEDQRLSTRIFMTFLSMTKPERCRCFRTNWKGKWYGCTVLWKWLDIWSDVYIQLHIVYHRVRFVSMSFCFLLI